MNEFVVVELNESDLSFSKGFVRVGRVTRKLLSRHRWTPPLGSWLRDETLGIYVVCYFILFDVIFVIYVV